MYRRLKSRDNGLFSTEVNPMHTYLLYSISFNDPNSVK